jgi:hypothetical protein
MTTPIPDNSFINDIRESGEFKSIAFSGYKNTEVKKQFIDSLLRGKVEPACYWCAEMICAGHFLDIWECILFYLGKHIHSANPKIVIYLQKRYTIFKNIIDQGHFMSILELRNNSTIRQLFAEMVVIIVHSPKKQSFETLKIDKVEEFDITHMTDRLKAPSISYMGELLDKEDPKELMIVVNEFAYHISEDSRNMHSAVFWIEWIIEFENICKKRNEPARCKRRSYHVENKFQTDIIWIFWDAILAQAKRVSVFIENLERGLLELFCIKYTTATSKKRKYLLYYAIELLTEPILTGVELIDASKKDNIAFINEKIHLIYKQIKKNECSPNTDYLFMGSDKKESFANSIRKMEMMNTMDFLPRNNGDNNDII